MEIYSNVGHVEALASKPDVNRLASIEANIRLRGGLHMAAAIADGAFRRLAAGNINFEEVGVLIFEVEVALKTSKEALLLLATIGYPTEGSA